MRRADAARLGRRALLAGLPAAVAAAPMRARADDPARPATGEMRIAFKDDIATLDPAIGYDLDNWSLIRAMFDGLMGYRPGTATLEPRLAGAVTVSPDGLVHRFALRPGIRFHDGTALVASDVAWSLARMRDPRTASPGAGFYGMVADIAAPDDATVVITLERPSAAFLHAMALNFAFVVPRRAVERAGDGFGRAPVGTGPLRLESWLPGERLTLAANRDYFLPGLPALDRLVVRIGIEPVTAVLAFRRGELDALGDGIPPSQFAALRNDPATAGEIVSGPRLSTVFLSMRTDRAPFDDLRVRRAIAHSIDRAHLVRLLNGRIVPAEGILPPGMPGYDPRAAAPAYDPELARRLLAEAGHPRGFETTLLASATDPYPRLAEALQQYLADAGVSATLETLADASVSERASDADGPPLVFSGGLAWSADYPDPSDFYTPVLSCAAARPGGWNWAWHRDPALDDAARRADAIADEADRLAAWRAVFARVAAAQPWVPLYHERSVTLVSNRLSGPAGVFADPISSPINYPCVRAA